MQNNIKYYYVKTVFKNLKKLGLIDDIEYSRMIKKIIKLYGNIEEKQSNNTLDISALMSDICIQEDDNNER